jgi:hypothetical protein
LHPARAHVALPADAGAGPRGVLGAADLICADIAERGMPGSSFKQWRAFLSATAGEDGEQVDAIDRIGDGPWYDRIGRLVTLTRNGLLQTRLEGGDEDIVDDLPNENGVPDSEVDPVAETASERNHHTMTGSRTDGRLLPVGCIEESGSRACSACAWTSARRRGAPVLGTTSARIASCPSRTRTCSTRSAGSACEGLDGYGAECDEPVGSTCLDRTTTDTELENGPPRIGLSWPREDRAIDQERISWYSVGRRTRGRYRRRPWGARGRTVRLVRWHLLLRLGALMVATLLPVLVAGCTGQTLDSVQVLGGLDVYGAFQVELVPAVADDPGQAAILGRLYDGPTSSTVIWEVAATEGACELLTPRVPFCDSSCPGTEACVEDAERQLYPTVIDVGDVLVEGVESTDGASRFTMEPIARYYQPPAAIDLAYPPFSEGEEVTFTASGSESSSPFTMTARGIAPLEVTTETLDLVDGESVEVAWTPGEEPELADLLISINISYHARAPSCCRPRSWTDSRRWGARAGPSSCTRG